jgi:hypothetical protein
VIVGVAFIALLCVWLYALVREMLKRDPTW